MRYTSKLLPLGKPVVCIYHICLHKYFYNMSMETQSHETINSHETCE